MLNSNKGSGFNKVAELEDEEESKDEESKDEENKDEENK